MEVDWLKRWNLYSPDNLAIKDGETGQSFTYGQLYHAALAKASQLRANFGIKKGDRISVLSENDLEYVVLLFASQRLGAILVPINFRLTQREIEHVLSDSEPSLLIYQKEYTSIVQNISATGLVPQTSLLNDDYVRQADISDTSFLGTFQDPYMLLYTSGTTGAPKGALLTFEMLFWNSINTTLRLNLSEKDRTVIFLPFFHTAGWNVLTTPLLHRGGSVIFLKKFDAEKVIELSESEKATILFGVPTTMSLMARSPAFENSDLSNIRYAIVGGEPMPIQLIKTWGDRNIPIRQGYGLTEFGPSVFSLNESDAIRKIGSIGFPNFYVETKIINNSGLTVGPNEIGELLLKGPSCMQGYWRNEKATRETIRDGWLYTGDLVRQDPEGYVYIVGRKKDMYISGGENVYPSEIEQVLMSHSGIQEAAVIGTLDEKWGEVGAAFIVKESSELTEADVQEYCLKNLAKFKIPKKIIFLPELPKGDSGKILKKKLILPV